jgi:hypothetical protein
LAHEAREAVREQLERDLMEDGDGFAKFSDKEDEDEMDVAVDLSVPFGMDLTRVP